MVSIRAFNNSQLKLRYRRFRAIHAVHLKLASSSSISIGSRQRLSRIALKPRKLVGISQTRGYKLHRTDNSLTSRNKGLTRIPAVTSSLTVSTPARAWCSILFRMKCLSGSMTQ